mmetsp:Transcript_10785/g.14923  ORF Transcript_10785/g.14923 Transcript_10785/m.14923 type:complete len:130 (-) Transcript_10785:574-963(-)
MVILMLYGAEGRQELGEAHYMMVICACNLIFCVLSLTADIYNVQIQYPDLWPLSEFALEVTFMTISFFAAVTLASACRSPYHDDESHCEHYLKSNFTGLVSSGFCFCLSIVMYQSVQETYKRVRKYQFS